MSGDITRFLHASDFELGTPIFGVAGLPADLRSLMATARYRAAERVFDAAIDENVDFVLLSGGIMGDLPRDSRGMWFFATQCERLADRRIPVYWIEETDATQGWADYVPLPSNVYQADPKIGQQFNFVSDCGAPIRIAAGSEFQDHFADDAAATICVLPDGLEDQPLSAAGVDYWALGGRSAPGAVPAVCGLAQFAGSPQGRAPSEPGPRGCQLVTIDHDRVVRSTLLTCDVVRWHEERVQITEDADWQQLCQLLLERKQQIARVVDTNAVMVRWTLHGHGALWQQLLRDEVCNRLLSALRDQTGASATRIWSLVVEPVPDQEEMSFWEQIETPFCTSTTEDQAAHSLAGPHFAGPVRQRVVREAARLLANQR